MVHLSSNAQLNYWNQSSWVYPAIWCYTSIKFQERNLALKNKDKQKSQTLHKNTCDWFSFCMISQYLVFFNQFPLIYCYHNISN